MQCRPSFSFSETNSSIGKWVRLLCAKWVSQRHNFTRNESTELQGCVSTCECLSREIANMFRCVTMTTKKAKSLTQSLLVSWGTDSPPEDIKKSISSTSSKNCLMTTPRLSRFGPVEQNTLPYWASNSSNKAQNSLWSKPWERIQAMVWCWERLKAKEEGDREWDGYTASPTQWAWI